MNSLDRLRSRFDEWKDDRDYIYEGLVLEFTERIVAKMIDTGMKRSELAERLGTSRAYVTKLLDGQENMTLKTVVRVAAALDMDVDLMLRPREAAPKTKRKPAIKNPLAKTPAAKKANPTKKRVAAARTR